MQAKITIEFDKELRRIFAKNETALTYLLSHERKPVVIKSCCNQIAICERQSFSINFNAEKYHYVINELVKFWSTNALKHAEEQAISRIERQRRIDEANRLEDAQGLFDEMKAESESTAVTSRPTGVAT